MIVIPARLGSTRFKNKILCKIDNVEMFVKTAKNAQKVDDVIVAVDDEMVLDIAKKNNLKAVMTSKEHKSGSDRINEVTKILNLNKDEIIINLQADEPFFEQENLKLFLDFANKSITEGSFMASCYKTVDDKMAQDHNLVKVILDKNFNAIYFSRSKIPYPREKCDTYLAHIGIYAYSVYNLDIFCNLKTQTLENIEKLEQLRAIESAKSIKMLQIQTNSFGIDTKEDYEKALKITSLK